MGGRLNSPTADKRPLLPKRKLRIMQRSVFCVHKIAANWQGIFVGMHMHAMWLDIYGGPYRTLKEKTI